MQPPTCAILWFCYSNRSIRDMRMIHCSLSLHTMSLWYAHRIWRAPCTHQCTSSINSIHSTYYEHIVCSQNQATHTTQVLHTHNTLLPCNTGLWYTRRIMSLFHTLTPPITSLRCTHNIVSCPAQDGVWGRDYKTFGNHPGLCMSLYTPQRMSPVLE